MKPSATARSRASGQSWSTLVCMRAQWGQVSCVRFATFDWAIYSVGRGGRTWWGRAARGGCTYAADRSGIDQRRSRATSNMVGRVDQLLRPVAPLRADHQTEPHHRLPKRGGSCRDIAVPGTTDGAWDTLGKAVQGTPPKLFAHTGGSSGRRLLPTGRWQPSNRGAERHGRGDSSGRRGRGASSSPQRAPTTIAANTQGSGWRARMVPRSLRSISLLSILRSLWQTER